MEMQRLKDEAADAAATCQASLTKVGEVGTCVGNKYTWVKTQTTESKFGAPSTTTMHCRRWRAFHWPMT